MWFKCKDNSYLNLDHVKRLYVEIMHGEPVVCAETINNTVRYHLCATTIEEVLENGRS